MDQDAGGRWVEDPILPEVEPPAPADVLVRGAQLLRRINIEARNKSCRGGHTDVVALAWARLPGGDWAVLAAWQGSWRRADGKTTGKARYGWVRLLPDRVEPVDRPPRIEGFAWYGWHEESEIGKAMRQAVLLLPEHLREMALTPKPPADPSDI